VLKVTKLYARSFDLDHINVFWEIESFYGDIEQFEFTVLRSESSYGPWDTLTPPFKDQYSLRDSTPAKHHKWRNNYYLLRIRDIKTNEEQDFGPTSQQGEPDLIAMEVTRQEDLLFREYVGRKTWLYPVRTFGAYCTCFDRVTGRRTKSNCLTCFDTGFLGGYLTPICCYVQFDPSGQRATPTPYREKQENTTTARLISFPQIKPKDILIEAENVRWRVESVTSTQRLRSNLHQELTLKQIDIGDAEFKLPVNIDDLKGLEIAAERNFTNPQHMDSIGDIDGVLAAYGFQPRGTTR
jgi:hypothetical protein